MSGATRIGVDETAQIMSPVIFDLDERRLPFGYPGKDHQTVVAFAEDLTDNGGDNENITAACVDMSKAFIKGRPFPMQPSLLTSSTLFSSLTTPNRCHIFTVL